MKILLVRLRLLGDVVFTTPIIRALRRRYPDAHLTYLVEALAAPVVRRNPHLNEVITVPHRRGLARLRDDLTLGRALRRSRYDMAIDLHGGPRAGWLTRASGAPMRIGYAVAGRSWMYTHVVSRAADLTPRHSVANQWDLLTPLGIEPPDSTRDPVEMPEEADASSRVTQRLAEIGIGPEHRLVVLHVSAGNLFRRWPLESFTALIANLARHDPLLRFIVVSGPSDRQAARTVAEAAASRIPRRAAVSHEDFDIAEVRALVGRAAVYIGGDSGPLHVAATTTTPIVALFGPTLPERSMPWRDPQWFAEAVDAGALPCRPCHQRTCVPGDFRCLTHIAPERVVEAAQRALQEH